MSIVIFIASVYAFLETVLAGYFEYKENNKITGIILYILSLFCLITPNLFA